MHLLSVHISNGDLINELKTRSGLMPIGMDDEKGMLTWMDMGKYHFYEGFFHKSLDMYNALNNKAVNLFTTSLDILDDDSIVTNFVYPSGFIFHAGRCGSTLISKSLARSREHLVISEASVLNHILDPVNQNTGSFSETDKHRYRNLVLAMCRRRLPAYKHSFIKFTSNNIHFFEFIHSVFPDVPAIFLTRNVSEIVSSFRRARPKWLKADAGTTYFDDIVRGFIQHALTISPDALKHIDYRMLTAENLPIILAYFGVNVDEVQLKLMQSQFAYDSKVELNRKLFSK